MFTPGSIQYKFLPGLIVIAAFFLISGCAEERAPAEKNAEEETLLIDNFITLATTTSTYDSGLLDYLNPIFTEQTGIEVQVISQGTGAALETGTRGDADVLLVHDRESELRLVEEGIFVNRYDVMYNDFIIVGPPEDPAGVMDERSAVDALTLIADAGSPFISRGDDSGTYRMEMRLWESAGLDPDGLDWYRSIGQGMGDTLNMANEVMAYTMADRGTYAAIRDKLDLIIVIEDDAVLFNQYGVMAVNPDLHPHVKYDYAIIYIEFLMSDKGQDLINSYQANKENLFFPAP